MRTLSHTLTARPLAALAAFALLAALVCLAPVRAQAQDAAPTTLAVLPFENNAVTDHASYGPLAQGLAAMLITDLKLAGTSLKVIERAQIAALLKEIAMGQTGMIDSGTAVQAGRLLGAQAIAFGSFMVLGKDVRMDARIIKVETSECILASSIMGHKDDFMKLERQLAEKIAAALKVSLAEAPAARGGMDAAMLYSRALEALDKGDKAGAEKLFAETVAADPAYKRQVDGVLGALK
ncbi:MAG: CsgG/HfaB family protein [Humidesulfovibrio sp.]|uniref:CsgG/HfaB family protein n=1 Tax=Humidesulfovibrio sp. TaxID=2910988 RepID=UPI0027FFC339|nr:CsgG/HfaB family protein [Humidesulfovibrio sp.]MDQ7834868.1 CsgG/HfaB family protein [Humidesulfovibrio sp.]